MELHERWATAVVGESGSGKSTLVRVLGRLTPPTSGTIALDGRRMPRKLTPRQSLSYHRDVQIVFQDPFATLNPVRTVRYHLETPLRNHGVPRRERPAIVDRVLGELGLSPASEYLDKWPHELSGGQRQRILIARALVVLPRAILADEPTSMLDVSMRASTLNLLADLRDRRGLAVLLVTHDLASAGHLADDVRVMYAGEFVEGGLTREVIHSPAHPYTRILIQSVPDPTRDPPLIPVQVTGEPPDLSALPRGCTFHPRCPSVMPQCRNVVPVRVDITSSHWVRCHLYGDSEGSGDSDPKIP